MNTLRSLEEQWKKDGKSKDKIKKLRWYHKNKEKMLSERRSLHYQKLI
jgi:hypothetical protein